jgi:hypothetical protein
MASPKTKHDNFVYEAPEISLPVVNHPLPPQIFFAKREAKSMVKDERGQFNSQKHLGEGLVSYTKLKKLELTHS